MTIIIFIIVLAVLILVHEFGHFIIAKLSGIRVDEFALGFPPKAFSWKPKSSETTYSVNWIPFGGFVKIFGEDGEDAPADSPDASRSFVHKPKIVQIAVLAAGVVFNIIFAWLLIALGFMVGIPGSVTEDTQGVVGTPAITVVSVLDGSPAAQAGLKGGDMFLELRSGETVLTDDVSVPAVQEFIGANNGKEITIMYQREDSKLQTTVIPQEGIVPGKGAIGIGLDMVATVKLPLHKALWEAGATTVQLTKRIAVGLGTFIVNAVKGDGDFSQVAGPVGIVGLVGDAAQQGFIMLISFTAFISLNLAVINLIPFPALDGGRILFVIIESIKGSPISPKVAQTVNTAGFALLLLLMVVITISDVIKLVIH